MGYNLGGKKIQKQADKKNKSLSERLTEETCTISSGILILVGLINVLHGWAWIKVGYKLELLFLIADRWVFQK